MRRFGRDILIPDDPNADIPVTPTGDIPTVAGRANVHAALIRRLMTFPGTMLHRPELGAGLVHQVELMATPSRRSTAANDARRNLLRDPRVADARVRVALGRPGNPSAPGAITISADVRLRGDDASESLTTHLE